MNNMYLKSYKVGTNRIYSIAIWTAGYSRNTWTLWRAQAVDFYTTILILWVMGIRCHKQVRKAKYLVITKSPTHFLIFLSPFYQQLPFLNVTCDLQSRCKNDFKCTNNHIEVQKQEIREIACAFILLNPGLRLRIITR